MLNSPTHLHHVFQQTALQASVRFDVHQSNGDQQVPVQPEVREVSNHMQTLFYHIKLCVNQKSRK
jgi:hypothetical protein